VREDRQPARVRLTTLQRVDNRRAVALSGENLAGSRCSRLQHPEGFAARTGKPVKRLAPEALRRHFTLWFRGRHLVEEQAPEAARRVYAYRGLQPARP